MGSAVKESASIRGFAREAVAENLSDREWLALALRAHFRVSELAVLLNVSSRTLERKFKIEFGTSPRDWLEEHRQQKVRELLRKKVPTKEIAFEAGYSQAAAFCRAFKKLHGKTPSEFS
jgi:AraC-like DNA-binding protein